MTTKPLDLAQFEGNLPLNWGEQSQLIAECKRLRAENARLRKALRRLTLALGDQYDNGTYRHDPTTDAADLAARALLAKLGGAV